MEIVGTSDVSFWCPPLSSSGTSPSAASAERGDSDAGWDGGSFQSISNPCPATTSRTNLSPDSCRSRRSVVEVAVVVGS